MTTPPKPKATEPSDEAEPVCAECGDDFAWNEDADRSEQKPYCNLCAQDLVYRFRAEVEALKAELEVAEGTIRQMDNAVEVCRGNVRAEQTERDKLHAAMAWREKVGPRLHDRSCLCWVISPLEWSPSLGPLEHAPHDGSPAGRAAALVRLWERCTDGK